VVGDPLYRPFARKPQELHEYLEARRSKLIEWSHLRVVNLNLAMNAPTNELIGYLREVGATNHSAVLTEKLGELLEAQGQHDAAIESCQQALKLEPSPQQAVRLTLTLAEIMLKAGKESDALDLYDAFFKTNPDYPGLLSLYTQAETLATRLKRPDAARRYAEEIKRRSKP